MPCHHQSERIVYTSSDGYKNSFRNNTGFSKGHLIIGHLFQSVFPNQSAEDVSIKHRKFMQLQLIHTAQSILHPVIHLKGQYIMLQELLNGH